MAIAIERTFSPADRYKYDFRLCTAEKGWAQIDTSQDASYFGQWINPTTREILSYCEGDVTLTKCETDAELVAEIAKMKAWNATQDHRFIGIDPGFNEALQAAIAAAGLTEYLHAS